MEREIRVSKTEAQGAESIPGGVWERNHKVMPEVSAVIVGIGGGSIMEERITRGKAIRLKCLDCCCRNSAEVRRCPATDCPLWRYRMGNENKAVASDTRDE